MIRGESHCPYCGDLTAGIDDDGPALAPDRADGRPCSHLAFLSASLAAHDPVGRPVPGRTGHWVWELGCGPRVLPDGPNDGVEGYVEEICCGMLAEESLPAGEYRVGGATAGCRDLDRPGSGTFPTPARGGRRRLGGVLDGFGMYAPDPSALAAEVRRLAGVA